jgi:DNA repair photolyase
MSVPTVDEDAWRTLEPGTAPPMQRLRAVRALVDAGVPAGVLMAPIVPGFSSSRAKLERTIKAIADHGARFVGCNVMYLQDGTRTHFMNFLQREFPALVPGFERLYARKYPPEGYRSEVKAMVAVLQQRHGLGGRPSATSGAPAVKPAEDRGPEPPGVPTDPEQVRFRW